MTVTSDSDIYYDPFNKEIDKDPHRVWKRMAKLRKLQGR